MDRNFRGSGKTWAVKLALTFTTTTDLQHIGRRPHSKTLKRAETNRLIDTHERWQYPRVIFGQHTEHQRLKRTGNILQLFTEMRQIGLPIISHRLTEELQGQIIFCNKFSKYVFGLQNFFSIIIRNIMLKFL